MGEAKPRTEGPGGGVELWKSDTDVQSNAAGRDAGSTAALAVMSSRVCAPLEAAVTAGRALWSWPQGRGACPMLWRAIDEADDE